MSDLFHKDVPDEYIARVFAVMAMSRRHTYQVLTKRPGRMRSLLNSKEFWREVRLSVTRDLNRVEEAVGLVMNPLPNVWLGTSVENQKWADVRIPLLMETPAAVHFLSCEPLLGPITLTRLHAYCPTHDFTGGFCSGPCPDVRLPDWIIVGGESGPGARPMHPEWARSLQDQCQSVGIAFLFKQWGEWAPMFDGTTALHFPGPNVVNLAPDGDLARAGVPGEPMIRVGKKAAGRELDGRTWDEYPEAVS